MSKRPLSKFRVLELGAAVAAPYCGALFAEAGAEVLKVESARRPDNLRSNFPMFEGVAGPERSFYFSSINRSKLSVTLDFTNREGRATFLDLVRVSDLLVNNFAAGTLDRLNLGYRVLTAANPCIVTVSASGFGATGPAKNNVAYGPLLEAVSGLALLGGYEGGPPVHTAFVYTDYLSAMYSAIIALASLNRCQETGRGAEIDLSEAEVALNAIPDAVLEQAVNNSAPRKRENHDEFVPVQGVFKCTGEDRWIAVAARTPSEIDGVRRVVCPSQGKESPSGTLDFAALEDGLKQWAMGHSVKEACEILHAQGVAAMPVNDPRDILSDPHLASRGALQEVEHPVIGKLRFPATPVNIVGGPRSIRRHAPLWGMDNHYVLQELLGISSEELARLTSAKALN